MDLEGLTAEVDALLADADETFARRYPGEASDPGPSQTLYVAAGDFHPHFVRDAGRAAERLVLQHAEEFLALLGGDDVLMGRVLDKLATEPVEDLRVDFIDARGDQAEQDARVDKAAAAWGTANEAGALVRFGGIRVPGLGARDRARSVRTLGRFLDGLGEIPEGFVLTVPAVATLAQIDALVRLGDLIEKDLPGRLSFEVQLEQPQAILGSEGSVVVAQMIHHAEGRLSAIYLVPAGFGSSRLSDHALTLARAATHDTGVHLADGTTLAVAPDEPAATTWQRHLDLVRRAGARGFVRGRDTHPAQLPTRYAAGFGLQGPSH